MTTTLSINTVNDLYLDSRGNIALTRDIDAVKDVCKNAAQAQLGEMIYNIDQGVATRDTLFSGTTNLVQFEISVRNQLLNVDGVSRILSLTTNTDKDTVNYTAVIVTAYGTASINANL